MSELIPSNVKLAAKRAFVRTLYQAFAATLGGGITASAILSVINGEIDPVVVGVTLGVALVAPLIGAGAAYFDIASKGIPEDYQG